MIRYRIKTEQEFINEFGDNWRNNIRFGWNDSGKMDYLFNLEINYNYYKRCLVNDKLLLDDNKSFDFEIDDWCISSDMIKQIGINYNEKKTLVYD